MSTSTYELLKEENILSKKRNYSPQSTINFGLNQVFIFFSYKLNQNVKFHQQILIQNYQIKNQGNFEIIKKVSKDIYNHQQSQLSQQGKISTYLFNNNFNIEKKIQKQQAKLLKMANKWNEHLPSKFNSQHSKVNFDWSQIFDSKQKKINYFLLSDDEDSYTEEKKNNYGKLYSKNEMGESNLTLFLRRRSQRQLEKRIYNEEKLIINFANGNVIIKEYQSRSNLKTLFKLLRKLLFNVKEITLIRYNNDRFIRNKLKTFQKQYTWITSNEFLQSPQDDYLNLQYLSNNSVISSNSYKQNECIIPQLGNSTQCGKKYLQMILSNCQHQTCDIVIAKINYIKQILNKELDSYNNEQIPLVYSDQIVSFMLILYKNDLTNLEKFIKEEKLNLFLIYKKFQVKYKSNFGLNKINFEF